MTTLEEFLRQSYKQQAKVIYRNVPDGLSLTFSVMGKGKHTVHLRGDRIVTLDELRKERPKKAAAQQKIEAGVKEAVS